MARNVLASEIITQARGLADQKGATFITDAEALANLAAHYGEWFDLILQEDPDFFPATAYSIPITGATSYAVPSDFGSEVGVDRQDGTTWSSLEPFQITERNLVDQGSGPATRYRMNGEYVELRPTPTTGTYRLIYHAVPNALTSAATSINGVAGWERLLVLSLAIDMKLKEGTDAMPLMNERTRFWDQLLARISRRHAAATKRIRDVYAERGATDPADYWPIKGTEL